MHLIEAIVARAETIHDVIAALEKLPDFVDVGALTFRCFEHQVRVGWYNVLEQEVKTLAGIRDLSLTCAPEVVTLLPVGERDGVLVTCYRAVTGERLLPMRPQGKLRATAVEQLRKEAKALADRGLAHMFVRHGVHWLVGSESGTIVFEHWEVLQPASAYEQQKMLKQIEGVVLMWGVRA